MRKALLLGVVISVIAITFLATQIDQEALRDAFTEAHYGYLTGAFALLMVGMWTRGIRWKVLLNNDLSTARALNLVSISYLLNSILPLRLGELGRVYLASEGDDSPISFVQATITIVVERLLDLFALWIMIVIILITGPLPAVFVRIGIILGVGTVFGQILLAILFWQRHRLNDWLNANVERFSFSRWLDNKFDLGLRLEQLFHGLEAFGSLKALIQSLWWTFLSWFTSVTAAYLTLFAFFDSASWAASLLMIVAASLAIAVPAVAGNLGVFELSIVFALEATGYGEPFSQAAAVAVMVRIINVSVYIVLGFYALNREAIPLPGLWRRLRGQHREQSQQ